MFQRRFGACLRSRARRGLAAVVAAASASCCAARVDALTYQWTNAGGGVFNVGSNWSPAGPPGVADTAFLNLANTYTVTFSAGVTNNQFTLGDGTVTLNLGGQTYALNTYAAMGNAAGATSRLTLANGTISCTQGFFVANQTGSAATATVGGTARIVVPGPSYIDVGQVGAGTLVVQGGSQASVNQGILFVGDFGTGNGTLLVSDAGSTVNCGTAVIGDLGNGVVNISGGGVVNSVVPLTTQFIGYGTGATGVANVSGAGSAWNIGGNLLAGYQGAGSLNISSGGRVSVTSGLAAIGYLTGSVGSVTITGAGSTWDAGSAPGLFVGSAGRGQLDVTNGGVVNSGPVQLAASGTTSSGVATVSGAGATWNCSSMTVGVGGAASLTVSNGGALNVGSSLVVNTPTGAPGGVLTLNGGTIVCGSFTRLGTLNFNDGTMILTNGIYQNGASVAPLTIDGNSNSTNPTLVLKGASSMINVSTLTVGQNRSGTLVLTDRTTVNLNGGVSIGAAVGSNGTIIVGGADANAGATASLTAAGTVTVGGNGAIPGGNGTLIINAGGSVIANGGILFGTDAFVRLNGGSLSVGTNALSAYIGSRFQFDAGQLFFNFDFINTSQFWTDYFFGPTDTLRAGMVLSPGPTNTLGLGSPLTIDGGLIGNSLLSTGSLSNSSVLTIKSGGVNVSGRVTNTAGGVISLAGSSTISASAGVVNNGNILLTSPLSEIVGGFANNATVRGTGNLTGLFTNSAAGQVVVGSDERLVFGGGPFTNSGLVSATRGEVQFDGAVTNTATGAIAGHDNTLRFNAGLANAGSLLFTSGQSDVFGDVVNNAGGKIIVSGGGTTTFYDTITNNAGAELRVSVGGTGVFFGAVNGPGTISGSGLKIFEGGQSSVAALATTTGSSVVEAAAAVVADNIRENSLTLSGGFTVRPNGTSPATSRLNRLTIDGGPGAWLGMFDLNDNALVIDYAATDSSPLTDVRNQIKSGYANGSWTGTGITSLAAAAAASSGHRTGIGYAEASSLGVGSFAGQTVDGTSVLVRYTLSGDSNMDHKVDLTDFTFLAANFNGTNRTWLQGDYNYDGTVDLTDFTLLASNFNQSLPLLADGGSLGSSVPEPCGAALSFAALATVLRRRRRSTTAAC